MIHVTQNRLPEIVQFGAGQQFLTPLAINAGNRNHDAASAGGDEISVSKYSVLTATRNEPSRSSVDEVIRAVVELGGTYPDVVQALHEAKNCRAPWPRDSRSMPCPRPGDPMIG